MASSPTRWVLTREALQGLLRFLNSDPTRAATEYERIRGRLMNLFRWRGCLNFEDYADETIDRVARRIADGSEIRATNPYALFHGVALNVIREHWRRSEREANALGVPSASSETLTPDELIDQRAIEEESDRRIECLRRCLHELPADSLALIKAYYTDGDVLNKTQRQRVAEMLKISVNSLRVRAFRIRTQVEKCVRNCISQTVAS